MTKTQSLAEKAQRNAEKSSVKLCVSSAVFVSLGSGRVCASYTLRDCDHNHFSLFTSWNKYDERIVDGVTEEIRQLLGERLRKQARCRYARMDLEKVRAEFDALQRDKSLCKEINLEARSKALDFVAFVQEVVRMRGQDDDLTALGQQAASLQRRLENVDQGLFQKLRADIRSGCYTPESLRREFDRYTDYSPSEKGQAHIGYDGLDVLVSGLLLADPVPRETRERTPEMVQYEATPARAILDLIDNVGLVQDDVFYDLGAGLGHIAILVNLLTGIKTNGIEYEPAFCKYAQKCARALELSDIGFVNVDARDADYSDGTIFFMFTPFKGAVLQTVLDRLHREAMKRTIRICTYGSCTLYVARQPWLRSTDSNADHEFKLAVFSSV